MDVSSGRRILMGTILGRPALPVLLTVLALVASLAHLAFPATIAMAINAVVGAEPAGTPVLLCVCCLAVLVAGEVLGGLLSGFWVAGGTSALRTEAVRRVVAAGVRDTRTTAAGGDVVSRVIGGTTHVAAAGPALLSGIGSVIPVVGSIVALAVISPWLALTFAVSVPFVTLLIRRYVTDTSAIARRYQQAQGLIAGRLLDAGAGLRTIVAAHTTERETARVLGPLGELRVAGTSSWRVQGVAASRAGLLAPMSQIAVLAVAGCLTAAGHIPPGDLLAAARYTVMGLGFGAIVNSLSNFAEARAAAGRLAEVLDRPAVTYGGHRLPPGAGRLEFDRVNLTLDGKALLRDVTFTAPAGRSVAVVGASGAGKSLVAALAGRLHDPDSGQVRLDGTPLPLLGKDELRGAVAYAFERPTLVGATVGRAIDFGPAPVRDDRIRWAVHGTRMDAFVRRLPAGLDTTLATLPLSGGEEQRFGLARALAHAGRLLVLDDATSSLDMATEAQIDAVLTSELTGCTKLIITHRLSTASRADLVVWLDSGTVRAVRPHAELWADSGYRALFSTDEKPAGGDRHA